MTDREALQMALDVLEDVFGKNKVDVGAITALRAALEQPEQEPVLLQCTTCGTVYAEGVPPQVPVRGPVAYMHKETGLLRREIGRPKGADWDANYWEPLYTTPPQRKPLTEEEIKKAVLDDPIGGAVLLGLMRDEVMVTQLRQAINLIARAVEQAHDIKETP